MIYCFYEACNLSNMKAKSIFIFILAIALIFFGCSGESGEESSEGEIDLIGTWELLERINHAEGGTEWEANGPEWVNQKHITSTHFTWVAYNKDEDNLDGSGGGTYTLEGNIYTEDIQFVYPVGSNYLGQVIPFEVRMVDGIWYHTGYDKVTKFDPEAGELVIVDSIKIEEKWVLVDGGTEFEEMVKTWDQISYKSSESEETYNSRPEFIGYLKLLTPTHYTWIWYDNTGGSGQVNRLGSGTWEFDGNEKYIEHIKLEYPSGSHRLGTTVEFKYSMEEGQWHHYGYVKEIEFNDDGAMTVLDSGLVDEIWVAIEE